MTVRLEDNVYNRTLKADQPKFKIWSSAGLMLTYQCPSRCACCYVFSGPDAGSSQTEMSVELTLQCWRWVSHLAGDRARVHLTGGEPFCDFGRLRDILQGACEEKLAGLEKIETNAFWCTHQDVIRPKFEELKALGLKKLQISTDIYHQEYVPIDRVRLAARVAREVFGPDGVQIRWRDFLEEPVLVTNMNPDQKAQAFKAALADRPERLLGRAAEELASLFPSRDYDCFAEYNCTSRFLGAQHVHIDGAGNVFSGTCIGIIVGNVATEAKLDELWQNFDFRDHPIISILAREGPYGLAILAQKEGYRVLPGYAGKCHLCYEARKFLYRTGKYRAFLGPGICYGLP